MKGVLDLQRRGQQIGRIRLGEQRPTGKKNRDGSPQTRPASLNTFRFTTQSKRTIEAIALLFGGTIRKADGEWDVITEQSEIAVTVPPRDGIISQAYEMWSKGGCQRRCNSQFEQISGGPCLCPHAADPGDEDEVARKALDRAALAAKNPPEACKLVTRISVMIPDLPGLGVWRLDTGSFYAAGEIVDAAELLEAARDQKIFLPAVLRIDHRSRVAGGQTKKYPVPVLEVLATFRQIASGELEAGGITAQLPPAPDEQPKALTAGATQTPGPAMVPGETPGRPDSAHETAGPGLDPADAAEAIAAEARASTTAAGFIAVKDAAEQAGLMDEYVADPDADGETYEPLRTYLQELWRRKGQQ